MPSLLALLALGTALAAEPATEAGENSTEPAESPDDAGEGLTQRPAPTEPPVAEAELSGLSEEAASLARVLLDDRRPTEERADAATRLGLLADASHLFLLRAAARDRLPQLQLAVIAATAQFQDQEATSLLGWVVADKPSDFDPKERAIAALEQHNTPAAGEILYALASDRLVPSSLRSRARTALVESYPSLIEDRGTPRPVTDLLGGATFITAWGTAGGVGLASVGHWGSFDGGTAIGAVGGAAMGIGGSSLYVSTTPLTTGQGLAQATGTAWGLTAAVWTTNAIHGRHRFLWSVRTAPAISTPYEDLGAAYRLAGVGVGSALGAVWLKQDPRAWDVLEVNLATYLGSAIALAGTGIATWRQDDWRQDWDVDESQYEQRYEELQLERWQQARVLDASNLAGAAIGMGVGFAIKDTWDLDAEDAAFAMTLGVEAAWVGNWTPEALGLEDANAKGTVRLPWNAGIAAGLAIAELHHMPIQTTAVTAVGAGAGNAIGAGIPMLMGSTHPQTISQVMVPVGIAGTVGGVLAAPWFDPGSGEWSMTALSSGLSAYNLGAIGLAAGSDVGGLVLIGAGTGAIGALTAGHWADPRWDHMVTLTTATAWGSFYGGLIPIAAGDTLHEDYRMLVAAGATDLVVGGTAVALSRKVGLRPRQTVVPQLLGVTGATVGALGAGFVPNASTELIAGGALVGATVGIGGGAVLVATQKAKPTKAAAVSLPSIPGTWTPVLNPTTVDGSPGVYIGIQGSGW